MSPLTKDGLNKLPAFQPFMFAEREAGADGYSFLQK